MNLPKRKQEDLHSTIFKLILKEKAIVELIQKFTFYNI